MEGNVKKNFQYVSYFVIKNLTRNIYQIVEALEQGFKLNGIFADQPLLAHAASPSSFGSPHILHIEAAYFADLSTNITAPVKRLLLTREGRINVDAKNA